MNSETQGLIGGILLIASVGLMLGLVIGVTMDNNAWRECPACHSHFVNYTAKNCAGPTLVTNTAEEKK